MHDFEVSRLLQTMGGKRRAPPSGDAQGKAAASGDAAAAHGGASRKRQARGLLPRAAPAAPCSVGDAAAGSADARSSGQDEDSGLILVPVTMFLSMRCHPSALSGRKAALEAALEAALRKLSTDFGGRECRVEWTRVGPSGDTQQRVLPLVLERLEPGGAVQLVQVRKPPPSLPPILDSPLPSLPLTARPVHLF